MTSTTDDATMLLVVCKIQKDITVLYIYVCILQTSMSDKDFVNKVEMLAFENRILEDRLQVFNCEISCK